MTTSSKTALSRKAARAARSYTVDLHRFADVIPGMVAIYNVQDGSYLYVNNAVKKMLGYTVKHVIEGGSEFVLSLVHPDDIPGIAKQNKQAMRNAEKLPAAKKTQAPIINFEYRMRHKKGHYVWLQTSGSVYSWTPNGKVEHVINISVDITDRKQKEEELRQITHDLERRIRDRTERLELALDAAQMGLWERDFRTQTFTWSPRAKKLVGLKPTDDITEEMFFRMIHPDDLHLFTNPQQTGRGAQILEHRVIWPDGSVHWMLTQGRMIMEKGMPVKMVGIAMNVDKLKHTQELEETTNLLRKQRTELLELNRAKDEFISLASHQLRTPATGVKQYLGMLREGFVGSLSPDQMRMLEVAYESNERQLTIIDDLLRVAHVDAGQIVLHPDKVNVVRLVRDVLREQESIFRKRRQKIKLTSSHSQITCMADQDKLRMVLENIIDNASKYTPPSKTISIELEKQKGATVIRVIDPGVGIAKKDLAKLFQKFSRVENPLSTSVGGTGLGLYWAKKIIDLHGGDIKVSSKLNKGTVFSIIIR